MTKIYAIEEKAVEESPINDLKLFQTNRISNF